MTVRTKLRVDFTLTFDDGPSEWTDPLLDVLDEYQVRATFFVTGASIYGRAKTLMRMSALGHEIGNHGYSHARLTGLTEDEVRNELLATQDLVEHVTGSRPTVWRAPYYDAGPREIRIANLIGLHQIGATIIPDDWMEADPEAIARVVLDEIAHGAVVSLHDGVPPNGGSDRCLASRQPTVDAVRLILEGVG